MDNATPSKRPPQQPRGRLPPLPAPALAEDLFPSTSQLPARRSPYHESTLSSVSVSSTPKFISAVSAPSLSVSTASTSISDHVENLIALHRKRGTLFRSIEVPIDSESKFVAYAYITHHVSSLMIEIKYQNHTPHLQSNSILRKRQNTFGTSHPHSLPNHHTLNSIYTKTSLKSSCLNPSFTQVSLTLSP